MSLIVRRPTVWLQRLPTAQQRCLPLAGAIETVAVVDADVFDEVFKEVVKDLVQIHDEGWVVRAGKNRPTVHIPFTKEVIDELHATNRRTPETSFSLVLHGYIVTSFQSQETGRLLVITPRK